MSTVTDSAPQMIWGLPRRGATLVLAGVWLVLLVPTVIDALTAGTASGRAAAVLIVVFAAVYLLGFWRLRATEASWPGVSRSTWATPVLLLLTVLAVVLIGGAGLTLVPYLAVSGAFVSLRWMPLWTLLVAGTAEDLTRTVPQWSGQQGIGISALSAGFVLWGVFGMVLRQRATLRTQEAQAQLALSTQRNEFARDLHDLLGHSLTVITVKAELAGRLIDDAPQRARSEIADLERLAREALADVRRAVDGYREITLPGELTRARTALAAAGIEAELPHALDEVPSGCRELFAWAVREGVTNVIRHSNAGRCQILVAADGVQIIDDGVGPAAIAVEGNGISGLTERAKAVGATVILSTVEPHGGLLAVRLPASSESVTT